ncbi:glutamine-rich protein 2 isoform X1 [Mauremys mutica]|uniref:glutamine-rich protein 2 isoform X1 n=1 Tax=Mauremys mutica TaxID=74926 RepID=UPI001D16655D|nr:glutamine-rich protein 2 isoform X1 [Mauremys mutica]
MALISLLELADLSIGTPEIGVVNFNALHTLLHAIIKQLNLQDVKAEMHDEKPKPPEPVPLQEEERKGKRDESEDFPYADLEKKVIGVAAQVHGVEAKVVGVAAQVHGVEDQVHGVKSQVHGIGEQVQGLEKQMAALEKLPSGTDLLERTKSSSPNGSAVADMWQMMQMKKKIEANENGISKAMALFQDLLNEVNGVKTANFHMNEGLENIKEKLGLNLQLDTQEIGNQLQTCIADQKNLDNDVRNLERRINLYPSPEEMYNMVRWEVLEDCLVTGKGKSPPTEQINHLEQFKCSRADLDKLRQFLSDAVPKNLSSMPADLMDQLSSLKATAEDMKDVKAKVRKLENVLEAEVATEADQKVKGSSQINLQLGYLRSTVHDIEKELQELREQQDHGKAKLEQSVTDTALYLQEQLDKLRSIIENMMTSSSTLLSMSMPTSPEPGEAAPHGTCPACSLDVSEQVSQLFKRYEQLQDLISSFMTRHAESKPAKRPPLRSQDEELLSRIQNTILQVQGDCENLSATTGNLIEDHRQKQKDIALLFQSLEKLEKEKANKEHLETEIDVKADKIALAGKVSRTQFDATTEQLNKMMQDLVNKMSGQEQDWHKVLDKILVEMDSKLDRLELDPFRQQLEERWKAIRKQLKERAPQYAADDAAGIRKRLMAHFHCISCDRPLEMVVPGPTIMTIPSVPGLPSHRSLRPYTVYELEQVRQHTRSLKLGLRPYPRLDALQLEKSAGLGKLRSIHSKMLMDIEKVQIHFGGSAKASSQMIREIMQSQCVSPGQDNKRDKMAEMAEYGYLSMPRRCGGSHTLTYPYRRYTRLQQIAQCMPVHPEETAMLTVMKHEEVDILGLDGHIYKGRMDTRLPSISAKDGPLKSKPKMSRSSSQRQPTLMDAAGIPARPHSAKLSSPSNSGTARSLKDRPVSSEGRLSRVDLTHLSASTPPPEEGREDSPTQEKETLELQLDLPMRRQSAEQPAPLQ